MVATRAIYFCRRGVKTCSQGVSGLQCVGAGVPRGFMHKASFTAIVIAVQGGVGICERSDRVFAPYSANACDAMDDGRGMGIRKKRSSNMVGTGAGFGNTKYINSR